MKTETEETTILENNPEVKLEEITYNLVDFEVKKEIEENQEFREEEAELKKENIIEQLVPVIKSEQSNEENRMINKTQNVLKCCECGKYFAKKSGLNRHVLIHKGIKDFKCSECGKGFTQKSSLLRHVLIHKGIKNFKCSDCGKRFTEKSSLKNHILIHKGIKDFECSECGKCFTHRSGIRYHVLNHK